jgi:hypothetical protein
MSRYRPRSAIRVCTIGLLSCLCIASSACWTEISSRRPINQTVGGNMRRKFVALDDPELNSWLLELIADPSPSFLSAIAEAVLTANFEDYAVVRPCLIRLRKKYRRETKKTLVHRERPVQIHRPNRSARPEPCESKTCGPSLDRLGARELPESNFWCD